MLDQAPVDIVDRPVTGLTEPCGAKRCGAHSYVKAVRGDTDLYFCAHHGTQFMDGLILAGFNILDLRDTVLPTPIICDES